MTAYLADNVGLIAISGAAKAKAEADYEKRSDVENLTRAREHQAARVKIGLPPISSAPASPAPLKPLTEEQYQKLWPVERLTYAYKLKAQNEGR